MGKKCWYTRESPIELFSPSCCVRDDETFGRVCDEDAHDSDIDTHCPHCGRKIKIKEYAEMAPH